MAEGVILPETECAETPFIGIEVSIACLRNIDRASKARVSGLSLKWKPGVFR